MKFTGGRRTGASPINLTPLIDCMFLLVIFIMIAARFEPDSGIGVDLPSSRGGASRQEKPKTLNLTVTVDGQYYLGDEHIPVERLDAAIESARAALGDPEGKDVVLVIYGDREAHHEQIVEALDAASRARHQKVIIRTKQ